MSMCGVTKPMMDALKVAPFHWTKVPEPSFEHRPATLQALEDRSFIRYRIGDDGYFKWRVTGLGLNFLRTHEGLSHA